MDGSCMPFIWDSSLRECKDVNVEIDVGLNSFGDTALRLYSHGSVGVAPRLYGGGGSSKSNWDFVDEVSSAKTEICLDLELGCSASSLLSKSKFGAPSTPVTSGKGVERQSPDDIGMDIDLNLGINRACNDTKNSPRSIRRSDNERVRVDLELSLTTVAEESDLTSVGMTRTLSSIEGLVDEGSTSSKWKRGALIPLVDSLQTAEAELSLSKKADNVIPVTSHFNFSSLTVEASKTVDPSTSSPKQQRRTNFKICQFPGCHKGARGASGRCISHGGGRRCQRPGCQKGAEGKTAFCKAHGGGRRCEHLGCTKSAEGRTNLCINHGGGRRCSFPEGCARAARGRSGLCIRHGGGKRCKMENCTKSAEGISSLCIAHGGGRRCQYPQCDKGAQGSTKFCKAHGGGKRCTFFGCTKGAEGSTLLCKGHGGGKRCSYQGGGVCTKSVHGGTLYCVSHGGGKRCSIPECTKSARGRTNFCVRHGGGRRCKFEECGKSAQGSTDFCKAHGGGKRCLWGQPGSGFYEDGITPCDKFARGKISLCAAHAAQVQDKRVHGNGTVGLNLNEIATETPLVHSNDVTGEGSSGLWNFGGYMHDMTPLPSALPDYRQLRSSAGESSYSASAPEGRVHGGSLMAMLRGG